MSTEDLQGRKIYFITHPDVVVDPAVPVPRWPLSPRGRERMRMLLRQPWVASLGSLFCSTEQKAIDGAQILSAHTGVAAVEMPELGENDRSSTGYLPKKEFEATADAFFARPEESVRGWECAADAQRRIIAAVAEACRRSLDAAPIAIVAHGGVGTLLLCHAQGVPISRLDQPGRNGGNYFVLELAPPRLLQGWTPIDA